MGLLTAIIGTKNDRELKRLGGLLAAVNTWEPKVQALADDQITTRAREIAAKIQQAAEGIQDDKQVVTALFAAELEFLPEVFALTRECSVRRLGMRPFDVQVIGGIALWEGQIAEMKTGEGKTLAATMPLTLHAMAGRGAHLVTVNDYLARRDTEWMGPIYEMMGLTVGLVIHEVEPHQRRQSYYSSITYGTNNEFGFDYLRDNMKVHSSQLVQRQHHYAIVDEVDSILIDEARTPLIISGPVREDQSTLMKVRDVVRRLQAEVHYKVEEKHRNVTLTDEGVAAVEKGLGVDNLYNDEQGAVLHNVENMVRAYALYKRDRHYLVKGREVILIDEHTNRTMPGRRLSEGLHQAIEAKENVPVRAENQTYATISLQNYFRMYSRLAGMTGTADTEAAEFKKIYNLDILVAPTNQKMIRIDEPDKVYLTAPEKFAGIYLDILDCYMRGQPVLVGTASVEMSELVSDLLNNKRKSKLVREILDRPIIERAYDRLNAEGHQLDEKTFKIPHTVLNAKEHAAEALVVAQGGRFKSITVATNMAGRGTDIKLGGDPEALVYTEDKLSKKASRKQFEHAVAERAVQCAEEKKQVIDVGGLRVIGTERHESRRIDNQLRGRSGRQGDTGSSSFYLSMDDDLLRIFGEGIKNLLGRLRLEKDEPIISHRQMDKAIERAQKAVEGHNFDIRKRLIEYDDVMNQQREIVYKIRRHILMNGEIHDSILDMAEEIGGSLAVSFTTDLGRAEDWDLAGLSKILRLRYDLEKTWTEEEQYQIRAEDLAGEVARNLRGALEHRLDQIRQIDAERYRIIEDNTSDAERLYDVLIKQVAFFLAEQYAPENVHPSRWDYAGLSAKVLERYGLEFEVEDAVRSSMTIERLTGFVENRLRQRWETDHDATAAKVREDWELAKQEKQRRLIATAEQRLYLWAIDHHWMRHLWHMDHLRESVSFSGYAQKNPLTEYKTEGFKMFDTMMWEIKKTTVGALFRLRYDTRSGRIAFPNLRDLSDEAQLIKSEGESYKEAVANQEAAASGGGEGKVAPVVRDRPKIGRNDPCYCGSGKKYKHCHWDQDHKAMGAGNG